MNDSDSGERRPDSRLADQARIEPGQVEGPEWTPTLPQAHRPEGDDPPAFEPFERLRSDRLYDSPWCGLRRDWIRLPDRSEQDYHVFEVTNAVAVVPILPDGRILMLWQYRYPSGRSHWEIPAGRCHANESPEDGARRELREETGHESSRFISLPGFFPTNGISAHYAHVFCALDCEPAGELQLDAAEQLIVRSFERAEVERRLAKGVFADGFTALSLFYALSAIDRARP